MKGKIKKDVKMPELGFEDLWDLLVNSPLRMNRTGSLLIIEQLHGESLLKLLESGPPQDLYSHII